MTFEQLHQDVHRAVFQTTGVERLDDVGTADRSGDARFAAESMQRLFVRFEAPVQHLQRSAVMGHQVLDFVDRPHPSGADLADHPELAEQRPADQRFGRF